MGRGLYSIVRYSNNLNDQRVNLGVLIWHSDSGYLVRLAPTLGRVQAVNANADLDEIKGQLEQIETEVLSCRRNGNDLFAELSRRFRDGIEISEPYPARMNSLVATAEKLAAMLITPKAEGHRPRIQSQFYQTLTNALRAAARHPRVAGAPQVEEKGKYPLNGVTVDLGVEVRGCGRSGIRCFRR
jgi:hypothetical protein